MEGTDLGRESLVDGMTGRNRWQKLADDWGLLEVDLNLLRQALTHASFVREAGLESRHSNQRLEFLGDCVLDLIIAEYLYGRWPELTEGDLTKMKSRLVREQSLAQVARELGLGEHLLLGRGEEESGGCHKPSLLADALEAVIGALWQSLGWEAAREFVLQQFAEMLRGAERETQVSYDHKSCLQELLQAHTKQIPEYVTIATEGPPHDRTFTAEARFNDLSLGRGSGRTKQSAEQAAAHQALEHQAAWLLGIQQIEE